MWYSWCDASFGTSRWSRPESEAPLRIICIVNKILSIKYCNCAGNFSQHHCSLYHLAKWLYWVLHQESPRAQQVPVMLLLTLPFIQFEKVHILLYS